MTKTKMSCRETHSSTNFRVFNTDLNEYQTVFGGRILSLVDDSLSVSASHVSC